MTDEIKTVDLLNDVYTVQIITYFKQRNYKLGLLLNFQASVLKNGIKKVINRF